MSKQKKLLYIGIALVAYILVIAFPIYPITNDVLTINIVMLSLRVAYLIFIIVFSILTKIAKSYTGQTKLSNLFLLLPLFFVAFTHIFYLGAIKGSVTVYNPFSDAINSLRFFSLMVACVEAEILFRFIIQKNLTLGHKLVRILVAAAIYALTLLSITFYSELSFNPETQTISFMAPIDAIEVVFQFGIGIILGFLYEYTNNLVVPITFSIVYTISNQILFPLRLSSNPEWPFYVTITLMGVFAAAYLCIFYFLMLKKENR